jgi:type II secretory pathway pseudopilin PulG
LIEMLAVLSILATLVAIVANSVGGLSGKSSDARLAGDADTIGTAADRFFTDAFPEKYPVVDADSNGDGLFTIADDPPNPAGDVGVREIDFNATLPQDGSKEFVPDFLKEVPDSAGLVSWRIDTNSGSAFSTEAGASLVLPAESDLDVTSDTSEVKSTVSAHTLDLTMKKNEAAIEVLEVEIPAGYAIGSGSITTENAHLGTLTGTLAADNDIESGKTIVFGGVLLATTTANA